MPTLEDNWMELVNNKHYIVAAAIIICILCYVLRAYCQLKSTVLV